MTRRQQRIPRPPGPSGPLFALGRLLRRDLPGGLERPAREYPRLAHLRLGREHVYLLHHPEPVTSLFLTHGRATCKGRASQKIRLLLGDGLLTSEGELHRRQRRLIQPALQDQAVRVYTGTMAAAAAEAAARRRPGETVDLAREMSALTLTVVTRALFGRDLSPDDADEVADCLDVLLRGHARHLLPGADLILSVPTPEHRRVFAAVDRLDALVTRLVAERTTTPDGPDGVRLTGGQGGDLLSLLARRMSPRQARDEAMTLLLAGHETTANALTWAWWLLDQNPDVAAWWREELASPEAAAVAEGRGHGLPHEALPRTRAVLAEAMRLYPPSWLLGRRLVHEIELDGWTLPAGSLCVAGQWVLHRDPRIWPEPERFTPQRWLTPGGRFEETAPGQPRGAYLPFGLGARACVGRSFAWAEGVLVLAALGRVWAPRLVTGHPVRPLPAITLRPRYGMPMILEPTSPEQPNPEQETPWPGVQERREPGRRKTR